jgi:N-methylhydantoinase A/oxoprolinase/acetone carboxylase beta subunit
MASKSYIIGIDTGGTYTDAVVIDRQQHKILSSAKALTTKGDLSLGVSEAMVRAVEAMNGTVRPSDISLVSVSTTLATNAVVEGHGGAVALVLIGFDDAMVERTGISRAFPGMPLIRVAGGHDHNGDAVHKLDETALRSSLAEIKGEVGAIAIASTFAVRNNQHEVAARTIVENVLGIPVTLSSELSQALDAPRRALTAVLNARLIGHISRLIAAVERAMKSLSIDAKLMIMKGDGSLASAESVATRPIETVLSGPAASLVGAKWLSSLDDFLMSDMGGTTTDVGILERGRPLVAAEGAEVGGWRTMVKAIDVKTIGLGGDSEVTIGLNGEIGIGPQRAVPVSLLADRFPEVVAMLEADFAETEGGSLLGRFVVLPFGRDDRPKAHGLTAREIELLALIGERPIPLRKIAVSSAAQRALNGLRKKGLAQVSSFTPSDAAHVLNLQDNWSREGAVLAAKLLARFRTMKSADDAALENFCREVWAATVTKSARIVLDTALGGVRDNSQLIDAVCRGAPVVGRSLVNIVPRLPIVAVGGPVRVYYGEVGQRLGAKVVFAPYCDVANAVGAASALVADRVTVTIEGDGNGLFRLHGGGQSAMFGSGMQALSEAQSLAAKIAMEEALHRGARDPKVSIEITKSHLPDAKDDDGLLTATVTAEAIGIPS